MRIVNRILIFLCFYSGCFGTNASTLPNSDITAFLSVKKVAGKYVGYLEFQNKSEKSQCFNKVLIDNTSNAGDSFEFVDSDKKVERIGSYSYKTIDETPLILKPGEKVSETIDLSSLFDFEKLDTQNIKLKYSAWNINPKCDPKVNIIDSNVVEIILN